MITVVIKYDEDTDAEKCFNKVNMNQKGNHTL